MSLFCIFVGRRCDLRPLRPPREEREAGGEGSVSTAVKGASASTVAAAIRRFDFRYADEDQLQEGLANALLSEGFDVKREVRLGPGERIDLLVDRVGVEVKVKGSSAQVARQLARYGRHDLDGLVLVTTKLRHAPPSLPIPIEVVCLAGASL